MQKITTPSTIVDKADRVMNRKGIGMNGGGTG